MDVNSTVLEQLMYEYIKKTDIPTLMESVIKAVKRAEKEIKDEKVRGN